MSTSFRTEAFGETVLFFDDAAESVIDLREPVGTGEVSVLQRLGLDRPFGIITAYNPGEVRTDVENQQALQRLVGEIATFGAHVVALDACSPDRTHCERSLAVVLPREALVEMARRYRQVAIFWFDGTGFTIVGT